MLQLIKSAFSKKWVWSFKTLKIQHYVQNNIFCIKHEPFKIKRSLQPFWKKSKWMNMWLFAEKGPIATKSRFETQLNAFSIWMLCKITLNPQVKRGLTHFIQRKEKNEEKKAVILVLLTQKQETGSTYLTLYKIT